LFGDTIGWRENSTKNGIYKIIVEGIKDKVLPGWLSLDEEKMVGKVLSIPNREDIETNFDEQAIVEYYSR